MIHHYRDLERHPTGPGLFAVTRRGVDVAWIRRICPGRFVGTVLGIDAQVGPFQSAARVVREIHKALTAYKL